MRLQDKVAVITGGANGIGAVAAELFAKHGAQVAIVDFDEEAGEARVNELKQAGLTATFFKVDVSDVESVKGMADAVLAKFGRVDILINNAGITKDAMLLKMDVANFKQVLDVNLTGVFNCTQAFVPTMLAQNKGKIINTSSIAGTGGNVGQTNYSASKAGIIGMTKTWAKEFGRKGITVNAVAPGFIETEMISTIPEKVIRGIQMMTASTRFGKPEDIANAYLFLASDESDFINGTVLEVDGGMMK
jgi:3-oxoacyl-[acyl-carrier protein] reductase